MYKTGDKVYCKSMKQNLVVACSEGEHATICIDVTYSLPASKSFGTFVISSHDLELGWKSKEELISLRSK